MSEQTTEELLKELSNLPTATSWDQSQAWIKKFGTQIIGWKVPLELVPDSVKAELIEKELQSIIKWSAVRDLLDKVVGVDDE